MTIPAIPNARGIFPPGLRSCGPRRGGSPERGGAAATLRVGIIDSSYDSMPQILHEVQARYPGLVIHQVEVGVPGQYQQLIDGRLDVGVGRAALAPAQVASLLFRQEPLGVLVPAGPSRASGRPPISSPRDAACTACLPPASLRSPEPPGGRSPNRRLIYPWSVLWRAADDSGHVRAVVSCAQAMSKRLGWLTTAAAGQPAQ